MSDIYTKDMHTIYKEVRGILQDFYPVVLDSSNPLPLTEEAIQYIKNDPYLSHTDEELDTFFSIWVARREYSINVCILQRLHDSNGSVSCEAPIELVAERARHVGKLLKRFDLDRCKQVGRHKRWREMNERKAK